MIQREPLTLKSNLSAGLEKKIKNSATTKREKITNSKHQWVQKKNKRLMINTNSSECWDKFAKNSAGIHKQEITI